MASADVAALAIGQDALLAPSDLCAGG